MRCLKKDCRRVRQRDGEWVSTGDHPSGERYAAEFAERRRRRQAEMEALKGLPCDTSFRNKPPEREPPPPVGTPFESEVSQRATPRRTSRPLHQVIPATMNEQQLEHHRASLPGADLLGYMPLRGDFDVEHENHAEQFVADMELRADDEPADRELKRQVLRWYNAKLDEREQRKRFVIDRGLLDYKRRRDFERRISPEQRRVEIRVRGFARFHSFNEHQSLVAGLVDMDRLAGQMMELKRQISLDLPSSTPPAISPPPAAAVHNQPTSSNARLSAYVTPRSLGPHSRGTNNMVSVNHLHAQQHARPQLPNTSPALLAAESGRKRLRIVRVVRPCRAFKLPNALYFAQTDETDLLSELERKLCDALQLPARKFLEVKEALSVSVLGPILFEVVVNLSTADGSFQWTWDRGRVRRVSSYMSVSNVGHRKSAGTSGRGHKSTLTKRRR